MAVQALNLRKYDLERKKLSIQVLRGCDSNTSEYVACRDGLRNKLESPGQFQEVINRLWRVVTLAEDNDFSLKMKTDLLVVYGNDPTLRGGNLDTHYQLLKDMKPDHPKYEPLRQELIRSAMHEINDLVKEYKLYLDEYVQTTRVARVASMVPTEGQWSAIVRQQNALERLLERKIRLLMELQEHRILYGAPPPGSALRPTPPEDGGLHSDKAVNSGNELHDSLQSKGITRNEPSKRTVSSAQNEPPSSANQTEEPALSQGERVARDGAFTSRRGSGEGSPSENPALSLGERVGHEGVFSSPRGSGEGSLHCRTHPVQNSNNSWNELNDLLQTHNLARTVYTKRTVSEASNELLGGVHDSVGPAIPIHEPTPHPSCFGWRKRRSPTPSPLGRGLLRRVGGDARDDERSADPSSAGSACRARARRYIRRGTGEGSFPWRPRPAQHTNNSRNQLNDSLQPQGLTNNAPSKRTGSSAQNEPPAGATIGAHVCASGRRRRATPRRALSGSADRRVCGPRFFVEGMIRGHRTTPGMGKTRTAKAAVRAAKSRPSAPTRRKEPRSATVQHHPCPRSATPARLRRGVPWLAPLEDQEGLRRGAGVVIPFSAPHLAFMYSPLTQQARTAHVGVHATC